MPDVAAARDDPAAEPSPWGDEREPETASPWAGERPIDMRFPGGDPWSTDGPRPPDQDMWLRANGTLPDDPLVHVTVGAYVSDITLLGTTTMPHARPRVEGRS